MPPRPFALNSDRCAEAAPRPIVHLAHIDSASWARHGDAMPPWNDYTIAIERRRGSPVVICEGTLASVITAMTSFDRERLHGIRVALTDRGARPYAFEHDELDRVMMHQTRPTATAALLLPECALS